MNRVHVGGRQAGAPHEIGHRSTDERLELRVALRLELCCGATGTKQEREPTNGEPHERTAIAVAMWHVCAAWRLNQA